MLAVDIRCCTTLTPEQLNRVSDQIAVEIQHKDPFLADKGAIEHVLAVPDSVVPFDRANVPLDASCQKTQPADSFDPV